MFVPGYIFSVFFIFICWRIFWSTSKFDTKINDSRPIQVVDDPCFILNSSQLVILSLCKRCTLKSYGLLTSIITFSHILKNIQFRFIHNSSVYTGNNLCLILRIQIFPWVSLSSINAISALHLSGLDVDSILICDLVIWLLQIQSMLPLPS